MLTTAPHPDGLLTTAEVAALTGRVHTTIAGWARRGHLPFAECKTVYGQKKYLFRPLDVVRVMVEKDEDNARRNHRDCRDAENETLEELELLIAERMKPENLPRWWHNHKQKVAMASVADLVRGEEDDDDE